MLDLGDRTGARTQVSPFLAQHLHGTFPSHWRKEKGWRPGRGFQSQHPCRRSSHFSGKERAAFPNRELRRSAGWPLISQKEQQLRPPDSRPAAGTTTACSAPLCNSQEVGVCSLGPDCIPFEARLWGPSATHFIFIDATI